MKKYLQSTAKDKLVNIAFIVSFLLFFSPAIFKTWNIFASPEFYFNGIAFLLISLAFFFVSFRHRLGHIHVTFPFILLISISSLYVLNLYVTKLSIASPILLILGIYSILGFFIDYSFWKKSVFVFLLLICTLPILERLQRFLGFPIRLFTANIVSAILQFLGISHVSNATVIMTENNATSIDLPCSGVKSIYTGAIFMLTVYYLQQVRLSIKLFFITLAFFSSLIFFNTWRVFSLVYMYNTEGLLSAGDTIHVLLGIIGFIASCLILWFMVSKYASPAATSASKKNNSYTHTNPTRIKYIAIAILLLLFTSNTMLLKNQPVKIEAKENHTFALQTIPITNIPFSEREAGYFETNEVIFGKKFTGKTQKGITFTLLVVSSKSARTHHDPEICLQGLGYTINDSKTIQIDTFLIRSLRVNDENSQVIYWFVGKDKNILDYSERVWEEMRRPNSTWILVELTFNQSVSLNDNDIQALISETNTSAKNLLTK